jgi:hypothetical protein
MLEMSRYSSQPYQIHTSITWYNDIHMHSILLQCEEQSESIIGIAIEDINKLHPAHDNHIWSRVRLPIVNWEIPNWCWHNR